MSFARCSCNQFELVEVMENDWIYLESYRSRDAELNEILLKNCLIIMKESIVSN